MTSDADNFDIAFFRSDIERRVRDQVRRHLNIDPNIDPRRVVEIQIQQEQEKLERLLAEMEDDLDDLAEDDLDKAVLYSLL